MAFSKKYMRSIIVLITFVATAGQQCMSGLVTNGYTVPQGDITLRYGDALNITCNLCKEAVDKYGVNASSRLYFERDNESIPREMVKIINSTSINLYIAEHPKIRDENYYCYFNATEGRQMICMNVVYVGVAPQNVTDFSCISRNCDNLTCTWTSPENYVQTNYNLTYNVKSRPARKNKTKGNCDPMPEDDEWFVYNCPKITTENRKNTCFWNVATTPQYRALHPCYYFAISMNNTFGTNINYITFDHYKYVLPNPPVNLTGVATSPHSIELSWTIPSKMITFSPGLHHRILYQSEYEKEWHLGGFITQVKNTTLKFELKNLKYAHILYDIRVSMKSSIADKNDESMWSQNATTTVRTNSKVPECPKTNVWSFQIRDTGPHLSRSVYVYWQQLKAEQYNGENLDYVIKTNPPLQKNITSTKPYVVLENLSFNEYVVDIWARNEMGYSSTKSTVIIPAKPLDIPSLFIKEHIGDLYEFSWQPPSDPESASQVTNYTIFWCHNDRDIPYQCPGYLNWKVVSKNTRKYDIRNLSATGYYQFAISANSLTSSSGMLWGDCTISPNKSKGKIDNVWIKQVDSTFIEVGWSLHCSNRMNTIQGFAIFYCPMESPKQTNCINGTEQRVIINGDVNLQSGRVNNLTPHTSYRLTVSYIINNFTFSLPSEALRNTTYEAAPATPPLHVQIVNVSNSSISLKWQPPSQMNGYLKNYYVHYNENMKNSTTNEITLQNLMSFTNYTISIEACTVACSNRSDPIVITTKMWVPGKINQPTIKFQNDSYITVSWERPGPARGRIDYYQVNVKEGPDMEDSPKINVTSTNYTLEGCASGKYKHLYISVRAVNIINGEHKEGPWSYDLQTSCTPYTSVVYVLMCSLVIFFGIAMLYGFKRLYRYIIEEKKFLPELPPGLASAVDSLDYEKQDIPPSPQADAELLLQKIEMRSSGDSSGCSSGQESITSSLESAHISPSDSGTEQPRSPSLNEENRKNSLRLRNVPVVSRPTINIGYVPADTLPSANLIPKPSTPSAGNYCVVGVKTSNPTKADTPYITITDLNSKSPFSSDQPPPYVMTGNLIKTSNPGYIPYTVTEPTDKNMGYVVTGPTKDLLASDLIQCDTPNPTINEEMPLYIRAGESIPALKPQFPWSQPPSQLALPNSGYVSVGDAFPPISLTETTKGYVPHRQFEGKSLKED